jgi:hypothetical protein
VHQRLERAWTVCQRNTGDEWPRIFDGRDFLSQINVLYLKSMETRSLVHAQSSPILP